MKDYWIDGWVIALLYMVLILGLTSSCRSVRYVPVEKEHSSVIKDTVYVRDSVYRDNHSSQRDSIVRKDSIVFVVDDSGKILRKELYSQKEIYSNLEREYKVLQDRYERLKAEKADTIYQDRPIYIEKQLSRWQQFRMDLGGWAVGILIIIVTVMFICRIVSNLSINKK